MKLYYLMTLILIISQVSGQTNKVSFMGEKWDKLMSLTLKEIQTINRVKSKPMALKYRLFELKTEKLSLIKQKENKIYLEDSKKNRSKESYFKQSLSLYNEIKQEGLSILKEDRSKRYYSAIYYTLALNSRDYGNDNLTEKYLQKSLQYSRNDYKLSHNARISLAEYYYNEKKYQNAQKLYEIILQNRSDDWTTKHLLNSAWCLFKMQRYDQAISNITTAYELSGNKKYIDVKAQILETAATFYVYSKKVNDGLIFFRDKVPDPIPYMHKMLKLSSSQGNFKGAHDLIIESINFSKKNKKTDQEIETYSIALDIYREHKEHDLFYSTSKEIVHFIKRNPDYKLNADEIEDKIKSYVGYLQISFTKNGKTNISNYSKKQLNLIIEYFNILKTIKPNLSHLYTYFQGETYFSIGLYHNALTNYLNAIEHCKQNSIKDEENIKKIFNSLFGTLEREKSDKNYLIKTEYAYTNYLTFFPRGEHSEMIYQKLYNIYFTQKKHEISLSITKMFHENYPKSVETQQKQIIRIIDQFIKEKNSDALSDYIQILESGFLSFNEKYIEDATNILGNILFEKYQKLDIQGKKEEAALGHISLFENPKYPSSIKSKSSFFLTIIYLEMAKTDESMKWFKQYFKHTNNSDLLKAANKIHYIAQKHIEMFANENAYNIINEYLNKFSTQKFEQKDNMLVTFAYLSVLLEKQTLENTLQQISKANPDKKTEKRIHENLLKFLIQNNRWSDAFNFIKGQTSNKNLQLIFYSELYLAYLNNLLYNDTDDTIDHLVKNIIKNINTEQDKEIKKYILSFTPYFNYQGYYKNIEAFSKIELPADVKFNEELFNQQLEAKFVVLNKITDKGLEYIKSGVPEIVIKAYIDLSSLYITFSKQIESYAPQGMPPEFIKSFSKQMNNLATNLQKKSNEFLTGARTLQTREELLTSQNKYLYNNLSSIFIKDQIISPTLYPISKYKQEKNR